MGDLTQKIAQASEGEIEKILKAVLQRYAELFPDWELSVISVEKNADKNEQFDSMIALLEKMKTNKKNLHRP